MIYSLTRLGSQVPIAELLDQMLMCREDTPATMKHLIMQQHLALWAFSSKIIQHEMRMTTKLDLRFVMMLDEFERLFRSSPRVRVSTPDAKFAEQMNIDISMV